MLFRSNKSWSNCPNNKVVRFYGEFLQSCRCHNASQVNKTIDDEFPIGKLISCCLNDNCNLFNNVCDDVFTPSYYQVSSDVPAYETLYVFEWIVLVINVLTLFAFIGMKIHNIRNKDYESLRSVEWK